MLPSPLSSPRVIHLYTQDLYVRLSKQLETGSLYLHSYYFPLVVSLSSPFSPLGWWPLSLVRHLSVLVLGDGTRIRGQKKGLGHLKGRQCCLAQRSVAFPQEPCKFHQAGIEGGRVDVHFADDGQGLNGDEPRHLVLQQGQQQGLKVRGAGADPFVKRWCQGRSNNP